MQQLWDRGAPATVREVLTDLVRQRDLAYTTVLTVMEKLYRKGYLDREPQGRAHAYRPLVSREEYTARLMREALTDSRDRAQALVNFVGQMTLDEAIALRSALTSYERKMLGQ